MRFIHTLYFTASAFCFIAAPGINAAIGETQAVEIVCSNGKGPTAEEESKCLRQLKAGLLEDYLAIWFQSKRGYSAGLITLLQEYQNQKLISVKKIQRLNFGSLMMEGYNLIVWEPI